MRTVRKQTMEDFRARITRLDPHYAHFGEARTCSRDRARRPMVFSLMGFTWFYLVTNIARNQDYVLDSLTQGSLPAHLHAWVMGGLAALMGISASMIALHALRYVTRRTGRRGNSGPLLAGAICALALVYTPTSVIEFGLGLLDENSRTLLMAANGTVQETTGIDLGSVAFVSSLGK